MANLDENGPSTWEQPEKTSSADWLVSGAPEEQEAFLNALGEATLRGLPYLWDFWALPHQMAPEGDWRTWMLLGGRGAGKTRAGAEWVRSQVEGPRPEDPGRATRVALVAETHDQAREVMIFGESGIMACSPPDRKPEWQSTRRRLVWPNGAEARTFSANDPEGLRGPQFDAAWSDELAKWPNAQETWDNLQFALRLGEDARQIVTTTPRRVPLLREILEATSTVQSHAPTWANKANLADNFLEDVRRKFGGTSLGRQELEGELVDEIDGALWGQAQLDRLRVRQAPDLDRVVVAVDPAVTSGKSADACGIMVVGATTQGAPHDWTAVVLEDATVKGATAKGWAEAAIAAMARHGASRLVAEVNQGGDLVEGVIRQVDPGVAFRAVRAHAGKAARAEPIAALYEQGRVKHMPGLSHLEDEMCRMTRTGFHGGGSPDRVDALVWALTELILDPARDHLKPSIRAL